MNSKDKKVDAKAPDMFLTTSEKIFEWIEQNARPIFSLVAILAVGSLGYVAYGYWNASQEQKAAEALFKPESDLKTAETKLREARAAKMQELAGIKNKKVENVRPADYAQDFAPAVDQMRTQIKAHADTKAALVAALNLANFLVQQKQFAVALEVLETPKYRPSMNDLLGGFWHMHRGLVFLENQKAEEALKEYQSVLDAKALKYFHPEAMLKTGVALELKGDAGKARETYERLTREYRDSEASKTAQQYLRLLELKPQQG